MPNAPAFMPSSTMPRILSSSAGVGRLFARPSTASRTDPCPMNDPTLIDFCVASSLSRNGAERHRRPAIGPLNQRRDALPDVVVRARQLEDVLARVVVDVDEAGRHDLPARVDHARRRLCNRRRDERDRVAAHGDIGAIPRAAGAVDDAPVADDEIVGLRRLSAVRRVRLEPDRTATADETPAENDRDLSSSSWVPARKSSPPRLCCRNLYTPRPADTDTKGACDRFCRRSHATRRSAPARCPFAIHSSMAATLSNVSVPTPPWQWFIPGTM